MDAAGLYELGYRHVPLPLSSLPTGSSGSTSPFVAIPIPLGVGGPGQQHARPLPLPPPHNGQQLLVDHPPLSGVAACVGGERKREGVATTVSDSGVVIHHPRPRPGVGVGLVGFYDTSRDTSGMMFREIRLVKMFLVRLMTVVDLVLVLTRRLSQKRKQKEATTPLHQAGTNRAWWTSSPTLLHTQ